MYINIAIKITFKKCRWRVHDVQYSDFCTQFLEEEKKLKFWKVSIIESTWHSAVKM